MGLTREQMNDAIKSSVITALGPSLVVLSAMIALLVCLGGPISWTRLSFIGSAMYEMMAAGFGTQAVGVTLGKDPMTGLAFANAVWTMPSGRWVGSSSLPSVRTRWRRCRKNFPAATPSSWASSLPGPS